MGNRFIDKLVRFGSISETEIAALALVTSRPHRVTSKHDLIREGDEPGPVFVVLEGWACRYKILPNGTRQILAFLMPGDSCDLHIGLLAEMDHGIQTITPASVATVGRVEMDDLLDRYPAIARAMYVSQLIDEGTMRAWITSMGRRSSHERVAHLLCELYIRARNVGLADARGFDLPLSQILLADALGMTPVHINRVFKKLRASGAIVLKRATITLVDAVQLAQIAGFDANYLHRRLRRVA